MTRSANKEKAKADRKKQIMEAAISIFSEKGFERATTKAIAAKAGVAEGTIFIYFPTKRDLLVNCLQQIIRDPLPEIFNSKTTNDEEIIRAFFINRFHILRTNIGMFKLIISEALYKPDLFKDFIEKIFTPGLADIAKYFCRKTESGVFKKLDPFIVARSLVGQVIFSAWMQIISGASPDEILNDKLIDTLTVIFLDGIKA